MVQGFTTKSQKSPIEDEVYKPFLFL